MNASPALPQGWCDGLGGSLALLAGRFTPAERLALRGLFAVIEGWTDTPDGWHPTRWPLSFDAALATMAARALAPSEPSLDRALALLDRNASYDALAQRVREELAALERGEGSLTAHALAQTYLSARGGVTSFAVHRGLPSHTAQTASSVLTRALDTGALDTMALVDAVRGWAPRSQSAARASAESIVAVSWPNFAVLVDGTTDAEVPHGIAAACATARSPESMLDVLRSHDSLRGAGLLAGIRHHDGRGDETLVVRWGSVLGWRSGHPVMRGDATISSTHESGATLALSVGLADDVGEGSLCDARSATLDVAHLARRAVPPPRAAGISELFFGARATPAARAAGVAFLRATSPPEPHLAPDDTADERRRAAIEAVAQECLRGTVGLEVRATTAEGTETDATYRRAKIVDALVLRQDEPDAGCEEMAARAIETRLQQQPELEPWRVRSDYWK